METIIHGSVTPDVNVCSSLGIGGGCNNYCNTLNICSPVFCEPVCIINL